MSRLAKFAHRKLSGFTGESDHSHRKLSQLAIQATSPEGEAPARLLKEIADGITSQKAAETDGVVKALSSRLTNSDTRIVLRALLVTDHLLRSVVEPKAANNLRSAIEMIMLPKIRRIAKGQPTAPGEPGPSQHIRDAAMRRLQEWSALTKQPAFADAYRDALVNTPSPPSSAATEGTPVNSSEEVRISPRNSLQKRPATPDSWAANGALGTRKDSNEITGSPPADDGQFVNYYSKVIETFDKLHQFQHYPLDDERIKNLRSIMEKNLDRLSRVQGNSHQKKAEKALKFAQQRLKKFSDYRPPAGLTSPETASSSAATSGVISMGAPPRYPPASHAKRKPSAHYVVPYGKESSDVYSYNFSLPPQVHPENEVVPTLESTIANATKSQRRMMCAISSACPISAAPDVWTRPPPVVLPEDLIPVDNAPASGAQPPPRPPTQQFVHPAPPPSQQSFPMMYYAPQPQPQPQPHHGSQPLYQPTGPVPLQYVQPPQATQVHPQNSSGALVNAYHQFSSYPRAG